MEKSISYNKNIGLIRTISCIAIFLYHLGLLKGGYLAVCTFFVLSGYLTYVSCFKKEKFSLRKYYINKLKHIYLPLVIVVFLTISAVSLIPSINWFNLKPEVNSILFGYNNFWQLSANLDYFARHINSPFMHFWYMGILLQFDLVFPFIYLFLRKIGDKSHKLISSIISFLLVVIFTFYFYKVSCTDNIMETYYGTFTRVFSLLLGVFTGVIHSYYGAYIIPIFKKKIISSVIFNLYLITMMLSFVFIDASSVYFSIAMIGVTIISSRLIDYSVVIKAEKKSLVTKIIKSISNISYEIYLVQYPVIFLFQEVDINIYLKTIIIIIITTIISYILSSILKINKKSKMIKKIMLIIVITVSLYGAYLYIIAKDHTEEMKELENKLAINEKLMEERQKEYEKQLKKQEEEWLDTLENLENIEKELSNVVTNSPIIGIGDSVMLGAIDNLYNEFPNGYFDAKISRTAWVANGILKELSNKKMLSDNIVINLGANGDCPVSCKKEIMDTVGDRKVFWFNTNNDDRINQNLGDFAKDYENIYIIDWKTISHNHPEYFVADKIHLTEKGKEVYTKTVYDSIYQVYLDEYAQKKDEILKEYEEKQKSKITFIGNDVLLNAYDNLKDNFKDAEFIINPNFDLQSLQNEIMNKINNKTLNHKVIFMFDKTLDITEEEYKNVIGLCKENELYFVEISQKMTNLQNSNVNIINFYEQIINNETYLMPDKIHLTEEGNLALSNMLDSYMNNKN